MNEYADYYKARIPEPVRILGLKLRPFALGHLVLLHRIESYFVGASETLTYEDLALSVLICSLPYKEALEALEDKDLDRFMRRWVAKLTGRGFLATLLLRPPVGIPLASNASKFVDYMASGRRQISYVQTSEGRAMDLPEVQVVRVILLKHFGGLTDEALMDRPWGLCEEDCLTLYAIEGRVAMHETGHLEDAAETAKAVFDKLVQAGRIRPNGN